MDTDELLTLHQQLFHVGDHVVEIAHAVGHVQQRPLALRFDIADILGVDRVLLRALFEQQAFRRRRKIEAVELLVQQRRVHGLFQKALGIDLAVDHFAGGRFKVGQVADRHGAGKLFLERERDLDAVHFVHLVIEEIEIELVGFQQFAAGVEFRAVDVVILLLRVVDDQVVQMLGLVDLIVAKRNVHGVPSLRLFCNYCIIKGKEMQV